MGGYIGGPYKKNGGKKKYSVQEVGVAVAGGGGLHIKKLGLKFVSFFFSPPCVHVYWGGGGVMVL